MKRHVDHLEKETHAETGELNMYSNDKTLNAKTFDRCLKLPSTFIHSSKNIYQ